MAEEEGEDMRTLGNSFSITLERKCKLSGYKRRIDYTITSFEFYPSRKDIIKDSNRKALKFFKERYLCNK